MSKKKQPVKPPSNPVLFQFPGPSGIGPLEAKSIATAAAESVVEEKAVTWDFVRWCAVAAAVLTLCGLCLWGAYGLGLVKGNSEAYDRGYKHGGDHYWNAACKKIEKHGGVVDGCHFVEVPE